MARASALQTEIEAGDIIALPVVNGSTTSADHVVLAVNSYGDVAVIFDEQVNGNTCSGGSGVTTQATMVFIPTNKVGGNPRTWEVPDTAELVGDPCLGDSGSLTSCEKPHVRAVGENFIAVYPRRQKTGNLDTKLEVFAVEVTYNTTGGYNTATYRYGANAAEGFVISDGDFTNGWYTEGNNGGNAGLAWFIAGTLPDTNGALAVYLHQTSTTNGTSDLYAVYVNYTTNGISGTPVETEFDNGANEWLIQGVLSKADTHYGEAQRVAPFLLEEDNNFLLLAVDEWDDTTPLGWISVWCYTYGSGALTLQDTYDFFGSNTSWHHRRPVMGMTLEDSDYYVGLAWTNYDDEPGTSGLDPSDIDWRKIEAISGNDPDFGQITEVSDYGPSMTDLEHARAIYAYTGSSTLQAVLYSDLSTNPDSIEYWTSGTNFVRLDDASGSSDASRPAYTVWNNDSEHYLIVVWDQLVSGQPRPFLTVIDLT